jgi:hypothetical protein
MPLLPDATSTSRVFTRITITTATSLHLVAEERL